MSFISLDELLINNNNKQIIFITELSGHWTLKLIHGYIKDCRKYRVHSKKKLLNELKKIRVNFSTKFNYIFPPKSNLFEMSCCNLVV